MLSRISVAVALCAALCVLGVAGLQPAKEDTGYNSHKQGKHEFKPHIENLKLKTSDDPVPRNEEAWAYVEVRPGAHMFWWLYYTTHPDGYQNRPFVIWLQGGPGASSTGYGNFEVGIGPLDLNLEPRNTTWIQEASVLFIDNPVGSGYSYVESDDLFTTTTDQIAEDLYTMMSVYLQVLPDFQSIPLYIFGQSYGGKMGAAAARRFHQGIQAGDLPMTLGGFAMGNSWIHPVDSTTTWAPLLYYMSNLDEADYAKVDAVAQDCRAACEAGNWTQCTDLWARTEYAVWRWTNFIDFYNILKYVNPASNPQLKYGPDSVRYNHGRKIGIPSHVYDLHIAPPDTYDELDDLMNNEIRAKLGIIPANVTWGGQSDLVFQYQEGAFMQPVVDIVGEMLNTTNMDVIVYQGQLDLICLTKGANDWVLKLDQYWNGLDDFLNAGRTVLIDQFDGQTDTFIKASGKFKYYWMILAGHAVPKDDGEGALRMLQRILDQVDV